MSTAGKTTYATYRPAGLGEGRLLLVENQRVLEVGFGAGDLQRALIARGNEDYGVDAGRDGLSNVFLLDVSEESLPFNENPFDAVYCYETFEHLTNPYRLFVEVRRVLRPGGRLFFTVPAQESTMGYGLSRHAFVYPGLMEKRNLERFFLQMHFRVEHIEEDAPALIVHLHYILSNRKREGLRDIMEVILGDFSVVDLYKDVLAAAALKDEIETELAPITGAWMHFSAAARQNPRRRSSMC
jgi:SAM-dependent methyltransferase